MATKVNLSIDQGTDFSRVLSITSDSAPVDLTGYVFQSQARLKFTSEAAFTFSFEILNQSTDPGKVRMLLIPSQTESLVLKESTSYLYDVEMTTLSGQKKRLFEGTIQLNPEATKV